MRTLKQKLMDEAKQIEGGLPILEKDYTIGYIIAGLMERENLRHTLVMKGGTALKKLYFGDYRFSEDLDFSGIDAPTHHNLENEINIACESMRVMLQESGDFRISLERITHKSPHPTGQESFKVRIQFPWHKQLSQSVKIEVAHDEPVILEPMVQPLIHHYDDSLNIEVRCYQLEEIVAEKLRAALQKEKQRLERGWAPPRGRDIYDIWRVLKEYQPKLNLDCLPDLLKRKCVVRNVKYDSLDDFFPEDRMEEIRQSWTQDVGRFVSSLPNFDDVLTETRAILTSVFSNSR
jgi:predicted nucleotidyltransferase component of viral defense system